MVIILIVFYQRKSFLSTFYDGINNGNYLHHESKFYERISRATERRRDLVIDQSMKNIVYSLRNSSIDASALLFAQCQSQNIRRTLIAMADIEKAESIGHKSKNSTLCSVL